AFVLTRLRPYRIQTASQLSSSSSILQHLSTWALSGSFKVETLTGRLLPVPIFRMDRNIRRENFGSTAGCDRLLQQLHHEFSRQSDRSRRQHAQHPHHAENTILSETAGNPQNTHWRNNLMLGQNSNATIFSLTKNTNYTSSDYKGFRLNQGAQVSLESPAIQCRDRPVGPRTASYLETREYESWAQYSQATRQDRHSILLDYDIFMN